VNKGLSHDIVGGVIEVLGGESGAINGSKARVGALDDVTLN